MSFVNFLKENKHCYLAGFLAAIVVIIIVAIALYNSGHYTQSDAFYDYQIVRPGLSCDTVVQYDGMGGYYAHGPKPEPCGPEYSQ